MRKGNGLTGMVRRHARGIATLLVLVVLSATMVGCYGKFPLTRAVYEFNGDVSENRVMKNLVFWAFVILPVYDIAVLGDAIIFNLVEFWTGEEMDIDTSSIEHDGMTFTMAPTEKSDEAVLTVSKGDEVIATERVVRVSKTRLEVLNQEGELKGALVRDTHGTIRWETPSGMITATSPAAL